MTQLPIPVIDHVRIERLWGRLTVDFPLDHDVNILTGVNGSGKTTILDIIASILDNQLEGTPATAKYSRAEVRLTNGVTLTAVPCEDGKKEVRCVLDGHEVPYDQVRQSIKADVVSTIDTPLPGIPKLLRIQHEGRTPELSGLDIEVHDQLNVYYRYRSNLSKQAEKLAQEGQFDQLAGIYAPTNQMKTLCHELFGNKEWYEDDEGNVRFILKADGEECVLDVTDLSSGEKQMLILLISTLTQHQRPFITFWDEPEVSLHLAWQRQLIRVMRQLNPHMQLIIATHSPQILYEGWEHRVLNVHTIVSHE